MVKKKILFINVFFLLLLIFSSVSVFAQSANNNPWVKIEKGQLWVLSSDNVTYVPYFIKGVGYEPMPIGRYPSDWGYPVGDPRSTNNNIYDDPDILNRDFSLLQNMNTNTIRIWKGNKTTVSCQCVNNGRFTNYITDASNTINTDKTKNTLDLANQYGLKVIAGFWVNHLTFDANNNIGSTDDNGNSLNKQQIIDNFVHYVNTFKGNRAILFWSIGNEDNYQAMNASGAVPRTSFEAVFGLTYGDAVFNWLQEIVNFLDYNGGIIVDLNSPTVLNILMKQYPSDYISILNILKQYSGQKLTSEQLAIWYSLVDQMSYAAHLAEDSNYSTGGKNYHPVAVVNGGIVEIGNSTDGATDAQLPNLDIWGSNLYLGKSFGTLFSDYANKSHKPLWISEFGVDAWSVKDPTGINNWGSSLLMDLGGVGIYDPITQSNWDVSLWNEILSNSSVTIGGSVMEYSDEWWKPYEFYCTNVNYSQYNNEISAGICNSNAKYFGFPSFSNPDGFSNENWFGLMNISKNPVAGAADIISPRLVYNNLQQQWLTNPWVSLFLNITGSGSGNIISSAALGAGLNCSFISGSSTGICLALFTKNEPVTLSFSSNGNNSTVTNWGNSSCANGSSSCVVTLDANINLNVIISSGAVAPTITAQPSSVTVMAPATVSFTVAASGTPAPTYQWMQQAPRSTKYAVIGKATSATYTTRVTTTANSGTKYQCVVKNSFGSVTSVAATLTVNVFPRITTQPSNKSVTVPAAAIFTVAASGIPEPTYQWMQEVPGATTYTAISGETSAKYSTKATTVLNNGTKYVCVVSNISGSVVSSAVTLTVKSAPVITAQPSNVTVKAPAMASFTVAAKGIPVPTYQWMQQVAGTTRFPAISGATAATYTTGATTTANSGKKYQCVVKNSLGSVTSDAVMLTVNPTT
ncbi:MAG: immunoglobulin domain-containing protein [Candidatus Omnitrophica bacterium]|nr:immunoglobulin domain-containing protein [Candidatus Omnitrophota bacterium]